MLRTIPLWLAAALLAGCLIHSDAPEIAGAWQLVKFTGGDGTVLRPDDRSKYRIEFQPEGTFSAVIDCNRGHGIWRSEGPKQLEFGPMAMTRAACPPGSLHDQIVNQLAFIRSYVIKGRYLYLSLKADGGIYEFEPAPRD